MAPVIRYKQWRMWLDILSTSLLSTLWIFYNLNSGTSDFDPILPGISYIANISIDYFIFFSNLLIIYLIARIHIFVKNYSIAAIGGKISRLDLIAENVFFSFVINLYFYIFFNSPGGWIISGSRGIGGALGNFWIDWVIYFILVSIVRMLLNFKNKLDRKFTNIYISIWFFIISCIVTLFFWPA